MASPRMLMPSLIAAALLLTGCLGTSEPLETAASEDLPPESTRQIVVHEFNDMVIGAHPPDPNDWQGGAVEDLPVAHQDTFTLNENATRLRLTGGPSEGSGMARVEVLAPDGSLVAVSKEMYAVGLPGVNGVSITLEPPELRPQLPAGEYTVVYRVLGAFAFDVTVDVSYTG